MVYAFITPLLWLLFGTVHLRGIRRMLEEFHEDPTVRGMR